MVYGYFRSYGKVVRVQYSDVLYLGRDDFSQMFSLHLKYEGSDFTTSILAGFNGDQLFDIAKSISDLCYTPDAHYVYVDNLTVCLKSESEIKELAGGDDVEKFLRSFS